MKHTPATPMTNKEHLEAAGNKCPACRGRNIHTYGPTKLDSTYGWQNVECNTCGATWDDIYTMTGYDNLETGEEALDLALEAINKAAGDES